MDGKNGGEICRGRLEFCPKNHFRNLYASLCGIFYPNSACIAREKSPTNCDVHLTESLLTAHSKGYFVILLCILMLMSIFMPEAVKAESQQTERTIRVAFPVQEGMSYFYDDGTPDGYSYSYLEKIREYTGWQVEYVPFDSGDYNEDIGNALVALESGDVDIFGPLLKNQDTEAMFEFPERSYGTVYTTLCALETSSSFWRFLLYRL